jgi:hypothetical protein
MELRQPAPTVGRLAAVRQVVRGERTKAVVAAAAIAQSDQLAGLPMVPLAGQEQLHPLAALRSLTVVAAVVVAVLRRELVVPAAPVVVELVVPAAMLERARRVQQARPTQAVVVVALARAVLRAASLLSAALAS